MPRRSRFVLPGVAHHITQRGNDRQAVFFSDGDRQLYLDVLARQALRRGTHILGYCLMTNHIHLVAVPEREDSLARTLGPAHSEYAVELNHDHERSGHLWQNRFFSCVLDERHLYNVLQYVDVNPVRAGLADTAWDWPWSSAHAHSVAGANDVVLDYDWASRLAGWDYAGWRERLSTVLPDEECEAVRHATLTGEPLGSNEFLRELEHTAGRRLRVLARGRPKKRSGQGTVPDVEQSLLASEEL